MGRYESNSEKAENHKSSAVTLLLVGSVGLVLIILFFCDILQLKGVNKYMLSGILGALFVLFIVMGVISLRSYKVFKKKATGEKQLTNEILAYSREHLTAELIDQTLSFSEEEEEAARYFVRSDRIKELLRKKFMNLNEDYLDKIIEELYSELYQEP